jgi:O-antigen/teichoic acid export membrane protein
MLSLAPPDQAEQLPTPCLVGSLQVTQTSIPVRDPPADLPPASSVREVGNSGTISLRSFSRAASVMVALTLLASATNYASNLVFGRLLSPASFGDLTALLALAVIIATPTSAAQTVIAERVAAHSAVGDERTLRYLIRHATAHVLVISVTVGALYAVSIPIVVSVLDLQVPGPAIALIPFIVLSYFWPYALGILQGFDRFVAYGGLLFGAAAMRIGFGVPWVLAGGGAGGAIAGQALGILVGIVFVAWFLRRWRLGRGTGAATSGARRRPDGRTATATLAFIGFAVMSNLDVLLAKLWLPSNESGLYAALVTLEKVILFLPGAVAVVMVPAAARARLAAASAARVLRLSALLVGVTTLLVAVPAVVSPGLMIETMFGSKYVGATSGVIPIVAAGVGFALLNLVVTYTVAIADRHWVWLLAFGVLLQVSGIAAFHASPTEVAVVQATVVFCVLVLNEILFHPLVRAGRAVLRTAG